MFVKQYNPSLINLAGTLIVVGLDLSLVTRG
jgi:hypothetical protein